MKFGVSTYSFVRSIRQGEMSVLDVIRWIANHGGEHVEIVPFGFTVNGNDALTESIREECQRVGIEVSNYAILSGFTQDDQDEYEREIERVMKEVDTANNLGAKRMRFDVAWRPRKEGEEAGLAGVVWSHQAIGVDRFEAKLSQIADACARIADYALQYDIVTSIENHLYFVQASERVGRLIHTVNRPNFRTTLDTGNFLCVDEDPVVGVTNDAPYASMVHLKDFYIRSANSKVGEGWFRSAYGTHLRGAIFGDGDIDTERVMSILKSSGYSGYASIEFEGVEPCDYGTRVSLDNARRLWDSV